MTREEHDAVQAGHPRYLSAQFEHGVRWELYVDNNDRVLGFPARSLRLDSTLRMWLVPLFGHTLGHAGVATELNGGFHLHVRDAYYVRDELADPDHPIAALSAMMAVDNEQRLASLETLKAIAAANEVRMNGYHDFTEFDTPSTVTRA